jgi:hypothetical protein
MKMFVAGLVVLIAGFELGAQEAPIALRESSWPEQGRVVEMRTLHDLRGGAYVPYIAEGAFTVLRTGDGGKLFPYMPEGFDGGSVGARQLRAIDGGSERYIAFIGRNGGGELIHLFGFGFWDDLSYCPLPETGAAAITDYALVSSREGIAIYTLAGGRLHSFSAGIRGDTARQSLEISRPGETVEAFGVFRERNQEISYGWYRVVHKEYWEITLFSRNDAGNLVFEKTGPWSQMPLLEHGLSPEGKPVFVITAGSAVSACHAEGAVFVRDLQFDAPFAAKRYSPALLTGASVGLLTGEMDGVEILCEVSHEQSGAPTLRELFNDSSAEILELFFVDRDRISLIYRSRQTIFAALIHPGGGIIAESPLPGASKGAVLFRHPLGGNRACVVSEAGSGELSVLSLLELESETWRLLGDVQFPSFFPEELHAPAGIRDNGLLLMVSPEALMLLETETSGRQIVEMENYDRTIALNGIAYLAASSADGIVLYRIGE